MQRPVIGVCTYFETVRWGAWEDRAAMVPAGYVAAVQRAGGIALLLPPDPAAITGFGMRRIAVMIGW